MNSSNVDQKQTSYFRNICDKITAFGKTDVIFYRLTKDSKSDDNRIYRVQTDDKGEVTPVFFNNVMNQADIYGIGPLVKTFDGSIQVSFVDKKRPVYRNNNKTRRPNVVYNATGFVGFEEDDIEYETPYYYNESLWCFHGLSVEDICDMISYNRNATMSHHIDNSNIISVKHVLDLLRNNSKAGYNASEKTKTVFSSFLYKSSWHQVDYSAQEMFVSVRKNARDNLQRDIENINFSLFGFHSVMITKFLTPCTNNGVWSAGFNIFYTAQTIRGAKTHFTLERAKNKKITLTFSFNSKEDDDITKEFEKNDMGKFEQETVELDIQKLTEYKKETDNYLLDDFDTFKFTDFINKMAYNFGLVQERTFPKGGFIVFEKKKSEDEENKKDDNDYSTGFYTRDNDGSHFGTDDGYNHRPDSKAEDID